VTPSATVTANAKESWKWKMEWVLFYTDLVFYARKGSFDTSLRKPKPRRSLEMEEHGNNNCGGDLAENQDFEGVILEIFTSKICQIILEVRVSCHHFREHPYLTMGGHDLEIHFGEPFHAPGNFSQPHGRFLATLSSWGTLPKFKQKLSSSFCVKY